MPLSELNQGVVALRDIASDDHRSLAERLDATPSWESRLDLIESLLARRILGARVDTAQVDWAVREIEAAGGNLKVGALSRELGCSQKHLISLFRDQVGIPPKLLAQLVRLERVVDQIRAGAPISLADLATASGFSDQAHLAREVKHFTGLTACQARDSVSEVADLFPVKFVQDDPAGLA